MDHELPRVGQSEDSVRDRASVIAYRLSLATKLDSLACLLADARFELWALEGESGPHLGATGLAAAIAHTRRVLATVESARGELQAAMDRASEATACVARLTRTRIDAVNERSSLWRFRKAAVRLQRGEQVWVATSERLTFCSPDLDCAACDALSLAELEGVEDVALGPDVPPDALERGLRLRSSLERVGAATA